MHPPALLPAFCLLVGLPQPEPPPAPSSGSIARALDQPVENLTVRGVEVGEALADLGKQVGVNITLDDQAADLLPWGRQTRLADLTISNATIREALPRILDAIGMTYEVREEGVTVVATPPLRRMERRATWDELKLLLRCRETAFTTENLAGFKLQYRITSKVEAPRMLARQLEGAGQGSVAEMLEVATSALGWVWFPEDDHLVIRTKQAQIANRLARRVTARYSNVPLAQVLVDLAEKAGVSFSLEPGMMLRLPQSTAESYTLLLQSTTIRQALELIAADTGIKYEVDKNGVNISLSDAVTEGGRSPAARSVGPYVAKISVPGISDNYAVEFLIRADELPAEVLETRQQMIEEISQKMRREMAPADTPPAPPPAAPSRP
jgi:hypothetical protein